MTASAAPLPQKPTLLAVDDTPDNLTLLGGLLRDEYRVKVAASGEQALRIAASEAPPDLILLDVMMPELDGYEVCRRLQVDPATRDIPVIFVTAVDSVAGEAEGFAAGGVDYVTKPFNPVLIKARIATHLALRRARLALERTNRQLAQERELVAGIIDRMRHARGFLADGLRALVTPVEDSNGDILLSARTPDGRRWLSVGDMTGHGLQAAIACPLVTLAFYRAAEAGWPAARLITELNTILVEKLPTGLYLAMALVEIAADGRGGTVWNAGLPPCLLRRADGRLQAFASESVPLGIADEATLLPDGKAFSAAPGDHLYVFTDGVTETRNTRGEQLTLAGVERFLGAFDPAAQALEDFSAAIDAFRDGAPGEDDFTFAELSFARETCCEVVEPAAEMPTVPA